MNQGVFKSRDGTELSTFSWQPERDARSHVYLLHGFGEHSGRYLELARQLNSAGHAMHSLDHRGHGRSQGQRARVTSATMVVQDYLEFLAAEPASRQPRVLLGHSMGGAAAAQVVLRDPAAANALVLSSPYLQPSKPPPGVLQGALGFLKNVAPGLVVERLSSSDLSRQPEESAAYDADPLVHHGGVAAVTAHSLLSAGKQVLDKAASLTLPLLILHGAEDAIAGVAASRRLLAAAGSRDKQIVEFADARHEVMNDLDRAGFYSELLEWLDFRF